MNEKAIRRSASKGHVAPGHPLASTGLSTLSDMTGDASRNDKLQ